MPEQQPDQSPDKAPCEGDASFTQQITNVLPTCMNCRKMVEDSLTRLAGRRLRKLKRSPACSAQTCVSFLKGVDDEAMRFHLASMAWWRLSADESHGTAAPIRAVMLSCRITTPEFGLDYVHRALAILTRLDAEQLACWFGCDTPYQVMRTFLGDRETRVGSHCGKCRLLKQGCTDAGTIGADDCPLWNDPVAQGVAAAVAKDGGWRNPMRRVKA